MGTSAKGIRIGVCSWSLRPNSPADLARSIRRAGLDACQLALAPLREGAWPLEATRRALEEHGIAVLSGMFAPLGEDYTSLESIRRTGGLVPDERWAANLRAARRDAEVVEALGLEGVTFHAGFVPERPGPARRTLVDRVRQVADAFAERGAWVGLETGQETADTLLDFLEELDHPSVGINFDPANLILYGNGDPVPALRRLRPRVWQVHIKDARATTVPGTWGREVPVGAGEVDWEAFLAAVLEGDDSLDLVIEREAGEARHDDVAAAARLLRSALARRGLQA